MSMQTRIVAWLALGVSLITLMLVCVLISKLSPVLDFIGAVKS